jgi:hypothetical protein
MLRDYLSNILGLFIECKTATSRAMSGFLSKFSSYLFKAVTGSLQFWFFYQWVGCFLATATK